MDNRYAVYVCVKCGLCLIDSRQVSVEGVCLHCEQKIYPKRFYPCPFCRLPQRKNVICNSCDISKIVGFDNKTLKKENPYLWFDLFVWQKELCHFVKKGDFIIDYNNTYSPQKNINCIKPKFYFGNGVWGRLDYIPIMKIGAIATKSPNVKFDSLKNYITRI